MDPSCCDAAGAGGSTVQVCFPGARAAVLDNLNRQREEGRLCDLSIQVQGRVFGAHRCVLAASSPYFHDQVLLKDVTTVSLPSVMDPVAFESVLSSAYTGQLSIVHDDIVNYVTVASFLQMWHIVDKCTEILKRPRPPADAASAEAPAAHPGSASRQQSPSSTDCLYGEREGRRRERRPDALPPLATWRRPQQLARWPRPRPSSGQHLADSQLDDLPGYMESDYASCEEALVSSHAKAGQSAHDAPGHGGRHHAGVPLGEPPRQKVRSQQRAAPQGGDRAPDRAREGDEVQDRRRNERREIEADEGVGEEASERKEASAPPGPCVDFHSLSEEPEEGGQSAEVMKDRAHRDAAGSGTSSGPPGLHGGGVPGPSCPVSARLQWQTGPWSQPEQRPQEGEGGRGGKDEDEEDEEDADLECFAEGNYNRDTYDEIEDGTGQVSQRPLVSPELSMGGSEGTWPPAGGEQGCPLTPTSSRNLSTFPPPLSPPTPSSSSSVSVAGAPYAGKVHFCHCGKAYTLKSMRDRHVKMQHLNLRPFGCPVCTKSFKMKHHLTKHLKTHGGLRPYECNLCGKKVIWRDSFLRHQARCEGLAASSSTGGGGVAAAADDGHGYGFDEGEGFLPAGQVKVEEVDFHREMEDGMGGLLGGVSGMVDELSGQSVGHVFKEEAAESFGGS